MTRQRVHFVSAVNAGAVSKAGDTYIVRDVCGAVDDIVMNGVLYPAEELAKSAPTLNNKPAPAGHPKDAQGRHISALNAEALQTAYIGAACRNARHEGGRTLADVVINGRQARAMDAGAEVIARLDAALNGTNTEPIHVSTGLLADMIEQAGESRGKAYSRVATNIQYDHLALLPGGRGAGTPADGVGMFLNAAGEEQAVEVCILNTQPEDRRRDGLLGWLRGLFSNAEISFDQISEGLYAGMPDGAWIQEVFARYAIWRDADGKLWKQDYSVSSDGSVAWSGTAQEVRREVAYQPVTNRQELDAVKEKILAALNAAGVQTQGLTDEQALDAYNALQRKPVEAQLTAANSTIASFEAEARRAEDEAVAALAAELAVNSTLTVDDLKKLGKARLAEIKAAGKGAAPVVVGNTKAAGEDEFANYSINSLISPAKAG